MRDSEYKIYVYHKLDTIDILDCVEWARNNFDKYGGETSPLWNEHVQKEFSRLNIEQTLRHDEWKTAWNIIGADMALQNSY